jgi:hypothetical protein
VEKIVVGTIDDWKLLIDDRVGEHFRPESAVHGLLDERCATAGCPATKPGVADEPLAAVGFFRDPCVGEHDIFICPHSVFVGGYVSRDGWLLIIQGDNDDTTQIVCPLHAMTLVGNGQLACFSFRSFLGEATNLALDDGAIVNMDIVNPFS